MNSARSSRSWETVGFGHKSVLNWIKGRNSSQPGEVVVPEIHRKPKSFHSTIPHHWNTSAREYPQHSHLESPLSPRGNRGFATLNANRRFLSNLEEESSDSAISAPGKFSPSNLPLRLDIGPRRRNVRDNPCACSSRCYRIPRPRPPL